MDPAASASKTLPHLEDKYNHLEVTGVISVQPVTRVPQEAYRWLIMGPTGAGKSSFIETLAAPSQDLGISKDQLESYTKGVTAYQVVNVLHAGLPVYLIDTPGFSDTKISEVEIMDMVRIWLRENDISRIHRLLFFTPINETRLAGTKRRTIEMIKVFLSSQYTKDRGSVIFVTTMWDMLHNDQTRQRASSNLAQLRDDIFKELIWAGSLMAQFMNTRQSALQILDMDHYASSAFVRNTSSISTYLYKDLHERVEGALQQKHILDADLLQEDAQTNLQLNLILLKNQQENDELLRKFISQLVRFGMPPAGFEEDHKRLMHNIRSMYQAGLLFSPEYDKFFSPDQDEKRTDTTEQRLMQAYVPSNPVSVQPHIPSDPTSKQHIMPAYIPSDPASGPVVFTTQEQDSNLAGGFTSMPYIADHTRGASRSKSFLRSVKGTLRRLQLAKGGGDKVTD